MSRRVLKGINGEPLSSKYRKVVPTPDMVTVKTVKPDAGSLLPDSQVIRFTIKASEKEVIRFSNDPFLIEFTATVANDTYDRNEKNRARKNAWERLNIDASKLKPAAYINPLLQGLTFFSKVDVTIDNNTGQALTGAILEDKGIFYQSIHRTFDSSDNRKEVYGKDLVWISNTKDRMTAEGTAAIPYSPAVKEDSSASPKVVAKAAVDYVPEKPITMSDNMRYAVRTLTFDSETSTVSGVLEMGCDGVFPICQQNQALKKITGQVIENKFLHPKVVIGIDLHLRKPLTMAVEKSNVEDDAYYGGETQAAKHAFEIAIRDMTLSYESMIVEGEQLKAMQGSTHNYFFDAPILRMAKCQSGVNTDTIELSLPKGIKLLYLFWVFQDQTLYNEGKNSFLSTRVRFPPNMLDLRLDLPGKEGIVFREGLKNLGVKEGYASTSLRAYHAALVRAGLYSKSFDEWFPAMRPKALGYDQVIVADMTPYNIVEDTLLTVRSVYNNSYLPPRWDLHAFCIVQQHLTYSGSGSGWSYKTLI